MSNSINTNIAAFYAQNNITNASNQATESVARLSSGNAIIEASDNVTALAIGTSIGTQVGILNTAQTNSTQGTSLLQVADGALAQIQSILQQQQSIANQAQSGSLTDTDRSFLNTEFQQLTSEIDSLAQGTTFNGVALINGAISGGTTINTNTSTGSTAAPFSASLGTISSVHNVTTGDTFTLQVAGQPVQTFTFGDTAGTVGIGSNASDSASNPAAAINNSGLSQLSNIRVVANATGAGSLTAYYTGSATSLSNIPTITSGGVTANTNGDITGAGAATFTGGTVLGNFSSGTINNNDTFTIGTHTITFKTSGAIAADNQVNIGGSNTQAVANLATFLNTYAGTTGFTDLSGITFSSGTDGGTGTNLYGVYTAGGSSQPALTTTYTVNAPITYTGGTGTGVDAQSPILTVDNNSFEGGTSSSTGTLLTIAGVAIHLTTAATVAGTGNIQYSASGATGVSPGQTLTDIAAYLNSTNGQTALSATALAGSTFTTNGTSLFATNPTNAPTAASITTSIVNQATTAVTSGLGASASLLAGAANLTTIETSSAGTDVVDTSTLSVGTSGHQVAFTFHAGATAGTAIQDTNSNHQILTDIAAYLNSGAGQAATNLPSSVVFSVSTSGGNEHLVATNTGATATSAISLTWGGTAVVNGSTNFASAAISSDQTSLLTLTGSTTGSTIGNGTVFNIGGQAITFVSGTAGAGQVQIGANDAATLTALKNYLNTSAINLGLTGNLAGLTFGSDNTHLYVKNDTQSALATTAPTLGASTAPLDGATVVTNASLPAPSLIGSFTGTGTIAVGDTITITGASGAAQTFTFGTGATSGLNVQVEGTTSLTLAQLVSAANANTTLHTTNGLVFSKDASGHLYAQTDTGAASTVTTAYAGVGTTTFTAVTNATVAADSVSGLGAGTTSAVGTPTGSLFVVDNAASPSATNYGNAVDLSGIANNASFVGAFGGTGSIGAITANYISTGTTSTSGVQFSVVVGNDTYTTNTITNLNLVSATATSPVQLIFNGSTNNGTTTSAAGGSFTLTLQPQLTSITSQNQASQLATGINAALASVSAYQNRNVLSYNNNFSASVSGSPIATLQGSSLSFNSNDFTSPTISSVSVSAPSAGSTDAKITAVVNGDTYSTASGIGDTFLANNEIVLVNQSNPNQTLTLTLGTTGSANLSNASNAAAFQTALTNALGLNSSSGGLSFQLGATAAANVNVNIDSATSTSLFGGASLSVSSSDDAIAAAAVVSSALNGITASRAKVGAYETQFNFAAAALQSSVQNESAAQSQLLDTNVASESTNYATEQVKLQAGISVLAQANQQTQALLKLIG